VLSTLDASWLLFSSHTPSLHRLLVCRFVCWQSMGEELLEQIGIMSLSNVWVTPVIALPVSTVPDCRETNVPRVRRQATYLTRLTRWTCPADRLSSYSERFTAVRVTEYQSATDLPCIRTHTRRKHFQLVTHTLSGRARHHDAL
jgi:hypothetical protein